MLRSGKDILCEGAQGTMLDVEELVESETLILTADTVVIAPTAGEQNDQEGKGVILGKPRDAEDARRMLKMLSGKTHHVVTGVCLTTQHKQRSFSVTTEVTFKPLSDDEISYYINHYQPFDKAGAYGIQEWIGYIGCTGLKGSEDGGWYCKAFLMTR